MTRPGRRSVVRWLEIGAAAGVAVVAVLAAVDLLTGWPPAGAALVSGAAVAVAIAGAGCSGLVHVRRSTLDRLGAAGLVAAGLTVAAALLVVVGIGGVWGRPAGDERQLLAVALATVVVGAVGATPLRRRLQHAAAEHVYGDTGAPADALASFSSRLARAVPMDELLLQLADVVRTSQRLRVAEVWTARSDAYHLAAAAPAPRATVRLSIDDTAATAISRAGVAGRSWLAVWAPALLDGLGDGPVRVAAATHLGALLGLVVVARDDGDDDFTADDDADLASVAGQLGLALHNVRLDAALQESLAELQVRNDELTASRARVVAAADEGRRRIERDLHDGAQQQLVALAVKLGLARQAADESPDEIAGLLDELCEDVAMALGEVRELAHGIYPPLLRHDGLAPALRSAARRLTLPVTIAADCSAPAEAVRRYLPEVETAVYFCCVEAMQNAAKHAGPDASIVIRLGADGDALDVGVVDDGAGFDTTAVASGQGFVNMADRIGAVGGSLTVSSEPGRGTRIRAVIPLGAAGRPTPPAAGED